MISDVIIWPLKKEHPKIAANGKFTLHDVIEVKFTLFKGNNGMFVGLPGKYGTNKDGEKVWYPDVKIVDQDFLSQVTEKVMSTYNEKDGENQGNSPEPSNQVLESDGIPF